MSISRGWFYGRLKVSSHIQMGGVASIPQEDWVAVEELNFSYHNMDI